MYNALWIESFIESFKSQKPNLSNQLAFLDSLAAFASKVASHSVQCASLPGFVTTKRARINIPTMIFHILSPCPIFSRIITRHLCEAKLHVAFLGACAPFQTSAGRKTKPPPMHRMRRLREPGKIHRRRRNCFEGSYPSFASFR